MSPPVRRRGFLHEVLGFLLWIDSFPAAMFRDHGDVTFLLDAAAAAELDH